MNTNAYREAISLNRFKTNVVMIFYFAIYTSIGLLLDIVISNPSSFGDGLTNLLTLRTTPYATLAMSGIGAIAILLVMTFGEKIIMSGSDYVVLDPDGNLTSDERLLVNIVEELSIAAGLRYVPKICMIEADYMNAFATGWSEKSALVAITTKLFERLDRDEISAVMAHELTHIRNADVRLTLVVGVLANIMLFIVNHVAFFFMGRGDRKGPAQVAALILLALQFVLPIITYALQMFLSRKREYMADAGAVELTRDPESMANALMKISRDYDDGYKDTDDSAKLRQQAYIFGPDSMFSTHPSLEGRITSLGFTYNKE